MNEYEVTVTSGAGENINERILPLTESVVLSQETGHSKDEFQRFEDLTRKLAGVPRSELDEKRKER